MIVREPFEIAYQADQAQREIAEDQRAEQKGLDFLDLEAMVKRWGTQAVLTEIAAIHDRVHPDGSKVLWSVPSRAYVMGGYDDPNPCSCEEPTASYHIGLGIPGYDSWKLGYPPHWDDESEENEEDLERKENDLDNDEEE